MNIGGKDIVLTGKVHKDDLDFLVRAIRRMWPNGLVQEADSSEAKPFSELRYPMPFNTEIFIYQNQEGFDSWELYGATETNQSQMIQVILDESELTIVVDDFNSTLGKNIQEILNSLTNKKIALQGIQAA